MDENKLGSINANIAQTVMETIPEAWSEAFV